MPIKMKALRTCYVRAEHKEYQPGDVFLVDSVRDADRLERAKKAEKVVAKKKPTDLPPKQVAPELQDARAEYAKATGKKPFMGWGLQQLRDKMREYQNRNIESAPEQK